MQHETSGLPHECEHEPPPVPPDDVQHRHRAITGTVLLCPQSDTEPTEAFAGSAILS